jgi:rSAM/selenodomain-associated transferase 1
MNDTCVLVFAKSVVPGLVKTRLMPALSAHQAARLHVRMVERVLAAARASEAGPVTLYVTPDTGCPELQALGRRYGAQLEAQAGEDLGARMRNALDSALRNHPRALLVGSDCPWLDAGVLSAAHRALLHQAPLVLVPAVDGGYVLVGMSGRSCGAMFSGIPWGTSQVMTMTRRRLREAGWSWHEMPPLRDVDRVEDLDLLPADF